MKISRLLIILITIMLSSCSSFWREANKPMPIPGGVVELARISETKGNMFFNPPPTSTFLAKLDNANIAIGMASLFVGLLSDKNLTKNIQPPKSTKYIDPIKYVEAMATDDFKARGQEYHFTKFVKIVEVDQKHSIVIFDGVVSSPETNGNKNMVCAMLFVKSKPEPKYLGKYAVWEGTKEIKTFLSLDKNQLAKSISRKIK